MREQLVAELGQGIFSIATDYPSVANCPLWVYVVRGKSAALVDSGVATTYDATIHRGLEQLGIVPRDVSLLIITHGHPDHLGGAWSTKSATGAAIAAPLEEAGWVEDFDRQWREYWLELADGYPIEDDHHLIASRSGRPVVVDRLLRDGDRIATAGHDLLVVQTRGHTRGHCAYLEQKSGTLFSGDAVQGVGTPSSDGRTVSAPMYSDVHDYVAGLRKLRALPFEMLCSAHQLPMGHGAALDLIDASLEFAEHTAPVQVRELIGQADGQALGVADVATALGRLVGADPPLTHQTVATAKAHLRLHAEGKEGGMAWLASQNPGHHPSRGLRIDPG